MKIPFGDYKGVEIDEVPIGYLERLLETTELDPLLENAVIDILDMMYGDGPNENF